MNKKRNVKKQQRELVEFFQYSDNIEIACEVQGENKILVDIIIAENSLNELSETIDKFISLFKKSKICFIDLLIFYLF